MPNALYSDLASPRSPTAKPPPPAPSPGRLAASVAGADELRRLDPNQWDALAASALEENPFYARQHLLAGVDSLPEERRLRALLVRGAGGALLGLFPFHLSFRPPLPFPVARGAGHRYLVSGAPLVHRERAPAVVAAWLDAALEGRLVPRLWALPHVDLGSPLAALIRGAAAAAGAAACAALPYERPRLTRLEGGFEAHLREVFAKDRRKELQRSLRRLGERGEVRFERAKEPEAVRRRLEEFLALEDAGWKGRAGTSFLSKAPDARFARGAYGGAPGREGLAWIDSLLLDGRPVAMSVNLRSGVVLFTPKCAYDENYRKHSPGLLLEYLAIQAFYEDPAVAEMDAVTTTSGHVVQGLWNARKAMGTLIAGPAGRRTALLARQIEGVHALKQAARKVLKR